MTTDDNRLTSEDRQRKQTENEMMAGPPWGYIMADGQFRELPKRPMVLAGMGPPEFDVKLPSGEVRHIVYQPEGAS